MNILKRLEFGTLERSCGSLLREMMMLQLVIYKLWRLETKQLLGGQAQAGWRTVCLMMKIISMNIRGVGENIKKKYLRELIRKEQTSVVCL